MTALKRRTAQATADLAWVASESEIHTMKGKEMLMIDSTETMMLRKSGASWKIVHIHWSSRRSPTNSAKQTAALQQEHRHTLPPAADDDSALPWMDASERQAIETGQGFAMARAAEAHGLPGPKHVLEYAQALDLSERQRDRMNILMHSMRTAALKEGQNVLAAETALDAELSRPVPDAARVAELADVVGRARGRLRNVHLNAHLAAAPALTSAQRAKYVQLRSQPGA
ncbi:MAG: nuclear transport factor 2 family protein [Pseudomonadota bacterium]|nr:nuclear transport factor 2 family protein [Pseudomonadota bacterium]